MSRRYYRYAGSRCPRRYLSRHYIITKTRLLLPQDTRLLLGLPAAHVITVIIAALVQRPRSTRSGGTRHTRQQAVICGLHQTRG